MVINIHTYRIAFNREDFIQFIYDSERPFSPEQFKINCQFSEEEGVYVFEECFVYFMVDPNKQQKEWSFYVIDQNSSNDISDYLKQRKFNSNNNLICLTEEERAKLKAKSDEAVRKRIKEGVEILKNDGR